MMKEEIIAYKDPKSPISEIIRSLRTNIQFKSNKTNIKTVLITSVLEGEGKSWISSNLAVTFAQAGKKVLILDADMRRGRQYAIFNALPTPGLSNYLMTVSTSKRKVKFSKYIQPSEIENLHVFSAGDITQRPSELLFSLEMKELLEELKDAFDIIIIDGTPCKLVTDSVILSRVVDSTIIVTAYNKTKKDDLDRVIKNIKSVSGNVDGIVINRKPINSKEYLNRYSYTMGEYKEMQKKYGNKKNDTFDENTNEDESEMISNQSEDILKQINEYLKKEN